MFSDDAIFRFSALGNNPLWSRFWLTLSSGENLLFPYSKVWSGFRPNGRCANRQ